MSHIPNALTVGPRPRADVSAPSGTAAGSAARLPPDILTYCYASRMVYVAPAEDYDVRSFLHSLNLAIVAD